MTDNIYPNAPPGLPANLQVFNKFSNAVANTTLYSEAVELYNNFIHNAKNPVEHMLIVSMLNHTNFYKRMDSEKFHMYIRLIRAATTKDDIDRLSNSVLSNTECTAQIATINRIVRSCTKDVSVSSNSIDSKDITVPAVKKLITTRRCPHCNFKNTASTDTKYIICGYNKTSFDYKGCGHDWCFSCERKLCKSWETHNLYNVHNRHHNSRCCHRQALVLGDSYEEEYCQCTSKFVNRVL